MIIVMMMLRRGMKYRRNRREMEGYGNVRNGRSNRIRNGRNGDREIEKKTGDKKCKVEIKHR